MSRLLVMAAVVVRLVTVVSVVRLATMATVATSSPLRPAAVAMPGRWEGVVAFVDNGGGGCVVG